MSAPLLTPKRAQKVARDHARRIVDDIDGHGLLGGIELTTGLERHLVEAVEHDLRESLENLRLPEEDGA